MEKLIINKYLGLWVLIFCYSLISFSIVSSVLSEISYFLPYLILVISLLITFLCFFNIGRTLKIQIVIPYRDDLLFFLIALSSALTLIEYLFFLLRFGSVPLLMANSDQARLELPISGYIHLIARLNSIVLPYGMLVLHEKKTKYFLYSVYVVILFFSIVFLERGVIVFYILPFFLKKFASLNIYKIFSVSILFILLMGFLKYLREFDDDMLESFSELSLSNKPMVFLYYLFGTFGFEHFVGQLYLDSFANISKNINYTLVHPFWSIFSDAYSPVDFQKTLFQDDSELYKVSGPFGLLILDYGYFALFASMIYGFLWGVYLNSLTRDKLWVGFTLFFFALYDYIFVSFYPWLYLLVFFIL